jgi:hypothetical protein
MSSHDSALVAGAAAFRIPDKNASLERISFSFSISDKNALVEALVKAHYLHNRVTSGIDYSKRGGR